MADYLLIRSGGNIQVVEALAVAADLVDKLGDDAQVDIATTETLVSCAQMGSHIRRVIGIPPLGTDTLANITKPEGSSWKEKLLSSTQAVKSFVKDNSKNYWKTSENLRLVRYDVVFDLDMNAFSLSTTKISKNDKIIGFDGSAGKESMTGASLLYHDSYKIPNDLSSGMRRRQLVARHFDYSPSHLSDSYIKSYDRLEWLGDSPYILLSGNVPNVFTDTIDSYLEANNPKNVQVLGGKYGYLNHASADFSIEERAALSQNAIAIIGNDIEAVLSSASAKPTYFIGDKSQKMCGAQFLSNSNELLEQLKQWLPSIDAAPIDTPPSENGDDSDKKLFIKK